MRFYIFVWLFILAFALSLISCARTKAVQGGGRLAPQISIEEQEKKSMEKLTEMLDITVQVQKPESLPYLKEGYYTIINNYPDAPLAEESYYRLILSELEDYYPPHIEEAERLYQEYFRKYPKPQLNNAINDAMVRFYYANRYWDKLAAICVPYLKEFIKTGELSSPMFMFFYSEAKFNLSDFSEAKKGYKILIQRFPGSREAGVAIERVGEIESIRR